MDQVTSRRRLATNEAHSQAARTASELHDEKAKTDALEALLVGTVTSGGRGGGGVSVGAGAGADAVQGAAEGVAAAATPSKRPRRA